MTAATGVGGGADQWSTCATWFDAENDGDLDLFVCRYVQWSRDIDLEQDFSLAGIGRAYGPPRNFAGARAGVLRERRRRARSPTGAAGRRWSVTDPVTRQPAAKSLGVALADLDGDGCVDLVVANDTVRNFVFHNRCDGTFEEIGTSMRPGLRRLRQRATGMGIDVAEFRDDGAPAVAIGNFANEMTAFYVRAVRLGRSSSTKPFPPASARRAAPR